MMALSCNQGGLLAWMLLLLSLTHVQTQCPTPVLPPHSSLRGGGDLADIYPAGTNLELQCLPGYEFIIIRNYWITCLDSGKWSILPMSLCEGQRCPIPKIENGHAEFAIDIKLGMKVTLACNHGFRMIGNSTILCVMKSGKLDWDKDLPVCEQVKCHRPRIPNGRVISVFQDVYTYQNKIVIECNPGYVLVGSSIIKCDADSQWKPPGPWCDKQLTSIPSPNPPEEDKSEVESSCNFTVNLY
ncbi:complement component receptor 1-like protein isoform X5 [Thamnophis elegans]|uniref:complement component receptor 1-like protein isoform X5 n=1 Tax=Thamnophis elegans TaxID=35005 RepID=UPI001378BC0F|nr:complement component receptor 1-like protein isoform X5 [Thamnophis elegans]